MGGGPVGVGGKMGAPNGVGTNGGGAVGMGGAPVVQILGYGVAILVLLGAGAVVLWRGGSFGGLGGSVRGPRKLQIEETRMLGQRQYLLVAQYEGRRMLLGVCPGRIDYLCPLDWEESGAEGALGQMRFPRVEEEQESGTDERPLKNEKNEKNGKGEGA